MTRSVEERLRIEYALAKQIPELVRGGHVLVQTNYGSIDLAGDDAAKVGALLEKLWRKKLVESGS